MFALVVLAIPLSAKLVGVIMNALESGSIASTSTQLHQAGSIHSLRQLNAVSQEKKLNQSANKKMKNAIPMILRARRPRIGGGM